VSHYHWHRGPGLRASQGDISGTEDDNTDLGPERVEIRDASLDVLRIEPGSELHLEADDRKNRGESEVVNDCETPSRCI